MANFVLQVPNSLRSFTISASASSNGSPPLSSSGSSGGGGGPVILELPVDKIRRPLMRTRANDPVKVQELMDSISEIGLQVPVSLDVIAMKLTSALGSQQYVAKFDVGQKKLSGITSAEFGLCFRVNLQLEQINQLLTSLIALQVIVGHLLSHAPTSLYRLVII
ncbi:sulfiredoxin, chloroplastic/mitochondrial isoform X1 [Rosa rugosa]|uniref:sulfiredoxin, chloroplastic/mitochondrial isoform X1 n=1 Tax=Rosa rugosa TaxID=74645 RepID=UPI002B40EAB9|nr:sulfiredoxin, chloroplastic/mitochondrial isoform X1 [Rosa rugosa]